MRCLYYMGIGSYEDPGKRFCAEPGDAVDFSDDEAQQLLSEAKTLWTSRKPSKAKKVSEVDEV